jgi:hypothetical protein
MTAREMHYDFKQKLNKIDSAKFRDLLVPDIDWKLTEAQEVYVKMIANPRLRQQLGFEINQRTIDDIRTIVKDQKPNDYLTPTVFDSSSYICGLPSDYWFLSKAKVIVSKGTCTDITLDTREVQHDDEHELSPFDRSSFIWRIANIRFNQDGLRIFHDGFVVNKVAFEYLVEPKPIHNAQDFENGTYEAVSGVMLTGTQPCELPRLVHREIVDLAVLITAGDLSLPDYLIKRNKLNLTN